MLSFIYWLCLCSKNHSVPSAQLCHDILYLKCIVFENLQLYNSKNLNKMYNVLKEAWTEDRKSTLRINVKGKQMRKCKSEEEN